MNTPAKKFATVEEYIASYPPDVQKKLKQVRDAVRSSAPEAQELISYNMPGHKYKCMLFYFAGHTHHIGIYPMTAITRATIKELKDYAGGKGTAQLPLDRPIPVTLIRKIVKQRVLENEKAALAKATVKKKAKAPVKKKAAAKSRK